MQHRNERFQSSQAESIQELPPVTMKIDRTQYKKLGASYILSHIHPQWHLDAQLTEPHFLEEQQIVRVYFFLHFVNMKPVYALVTKWSVRVLAWGSD